METVISKDGTTIAFDRLGQGPAVVLIPGATGTRSHYLFVQLAELLAQDFTVFNCDRRGKGDSGNTTPYTVEREIEDLEAVIDVAGGSAALYGVSSGAVLALEAASHYPEKVTKLVMYEAPFIIDDSRPPVPNDYVPHLNALMAEERRSDAAEYFMTAALGIPNEYVAMMKQDPSWKETENVAHTIAYDGMIMGATMGGHPLPADRIEQWAKATVPTLVIAGEHSGSFFHTGAKALVDVLPDAQYRFLEGQSHAVDSAVLAPLIKDFLQ